MSLEVKKIYVDSRFCTADSNSDSDLKIQLTRNIYLPEKCVMHIENIAMPHSWYSIEKGINDLIYVTRNNLLDCYNSFNQLYRFYFCYCGGYCVR